MSSILSDGRDTPILFTDWSYVHFMTGVYFFVILHRYMEYNIKKSFILWAILHTIYELKDIYFSYIYRTNSKKGFINNSSWFNSIGDTIYAFVGFIFGYYLIYCLDIKYSYIIIFIMSIPVVKLIIKDINSVDII